MVTKLKVQNIQCGGCVNSINVQLTAMSNISDIQVDKDDASVVFAHEDTSAIQDVINKLNDIGFPASTV